jgi:hypothetical protein
MRALLAPLSPRRRRWVRHLRSLPLDPSRLGADLESPGPNDFIMCGSPRTGTALLAAALFQPPRVVTVMEPWDGMRLAPAPLFRSLREEVSSTGRLARGRLDLDALTSRGTVEWCVEGASRPIVALAPDGHVGVKWPGYWQYLSLLPHTRFLVCVRHPYEVVASYRRNGGRLAEGLQYDTAFNRTLNAELRAATDDPRVRRVLLYDYVNERILPFLDRPNVFTVRYERWADDADGLLGDLSAFLGVDVTGTAVRIRAGRGATDIEPDEAQLIQEHCRTAEALGYVLDRPLR